MDERCKCVQLTGRQRERWHACLGHTVADEAAQPGNRPPTQPAVPGQRWSVLATPRIHPMTAGTLLRIGSATCCGLQGLACRGLSPQKRQAQAKRGKHQAGSPAELQFLKESMHFCMGSTRQGSVPKDNRRWRPGRSLQSGSKVASCSSGACHVTAIRNLADRNVQLFRLTNSAKSAPIVLLRSSFYNLSAFTRRQGLLAIRKPCGPNRTGVEVASLCCESWSRKGGGLRDFKLRLSIAASYELNRWDWPGMAVRWKAGEHAEYGVTKQPFSTRFASEIILGI